MICRMLASSPAPVCNPSLVPARRAYSAGANGNRHKCTAGSKSRSTDSKLRSRSPQWQMETHLLPKPNDLRPVCHGARARVHCAGSPPPETL